MMKVTDLRRPASKKPVIELLQIPVDTIFFAEIGTTKGIYLRTRDGIVALNYSNCSWQNKTIIEREAGTPLHFAHYQPVKAELVITENL